MLRKQRDCTIYVAKTKALISFTVTAKLICIFVFAYAKCLFSHDVIQTEKKEMVVTAKEYVKLCQGP